MDAGVYVDASHGSVLGTWNRDKRSHMLAEAQATVAALGCVEDVAFYYQRYLARRLSTRRYLSLELESAVLSSLGVSLSAKLGLCAHMLHDVTTSATAFQQFKVRSFSLCTGLECIRASHGLRVPVFPQKHLLAQASSAPSPSPVVSLVFRGELDVLTTSPAWPVGVSGESATVAFKLPVVLQQAADTYRAFYNEHIGSKDKRCLLWQLYEGSAVVSSSFAASKWTGDLIVSPLQMAILDLFNTNAVLTFDAIVALLAPSATPKRDAIAFRRVLSLALMSLSAPLHAILVADGAVLPEHPSMSSSWVEGVYESGARFSVNSHFSASSGVVQVHRVLSSAESGLSPSDRGALMAYRRSVIESTIVQVVKTKCSVDCDSLYRSVKLLLCDKFEVSEADVQRQLHVLVDHGIVNRELTSASGSFVHYAEFTISWPSGASGDVEESKGTGEDEAESKSAEVPLDIADITLGSLRPAGITPPSLKRMYSTDVEGVSGTLQPAEAVRVVTGDVLADSLTSTALSVAEALGVGYHEAELLCFAEKWEADAVVRAYLNDILGTRERAGLGPVGSCGGTGLVAAEELELATCAVCFDDFPPDQLHGVACGHRFCVGCWSPYLAMEVAEGRVAVTCMSHRCPMKLSSLTLRTITGDEDLHTKCK